MKKIIIPIVIVGVVVAVYMFSRGGSQEAANPTASPSTSVSVSPSVSASPTASPAGSQTKTPTPTSVSVVKTFTIIGKSFSFTPAVINVNKGDTVKIIFKNESGTHDWRIDEFNARTNIIQGGKEETIQFVADKVGTFEYYCSVGTHRQMGMKGNLIVK